MILWAKGDSFSTPCAFDLSIILVGENKRGSAECGHPSSYRKILRKES